jgi:hypothetical protein
MSLILNHHVCIGFGKCKEFCPYHLTHPSGAFLSRSESADLFSLLILYKLVLGTVILGNFLLAAV